VLISDFGQPVQRFVISSTRVDASLSIRYRALRAPGFPLHVFTPAAWRWQLCLRAGMSAITLLSLALLTNSPEPERARDPVEARRDRPVLLEQGEAERRAAQAALADAIRHDEDV
jgi:hypothetical protein